MLTYFHEFIIPLTRPCKPDIHETEISFLTQFLARLIPVKLSNTPESPRSHFDVSLIRHVSTLIVSHIAANDMLEYVGYITQVYSEQGCEDVSISGTLRDVLDVQTVFYVLLQFASLCIVYFVA